ncbi:anti-sigma factor domain-containing protein [Bacillus taeanensis]|uniref:anti-sigma factor domain-containing protein n=1 Tax=Bacillus taeanensis TaxID=273032 RepID=UPI0015F04CFB|nr:anti-sigma factor domain-containing protein [Bacillus taeanensis]
MTKRGIVVEVQKHKAIILTKDGSFETISIKKKQNLLIGQEIDTASFTPAKRIKTWIIPSLSAAAAALVVLLLFVSSIFPFQHNDAVAAYVSFDINPSIEVGVNQELEVITVRHLNEDGQSLFNEDEIVKYIPLADFSKDLIQRFKDNGYFNAYENMLIATAVEANSTQNNLKESLAEVLSTVETDPVVLADEIQVTMLETAPEKRETANQHGVSFGKYALYEETLDQENVLSIKDIQDLSYDELRVKISNNHHVVTAVNEASPSSANESSGNEESSPEVEEDLENIEILKEKDIKATEESVSDSAGEDTLKQKEEVKNNSDHSVNHSSGNNKVESIYKSIEEVEKQAALKANDKQVVIEKGDDDNDQEMEYLEEDESNKIERNE